MSGRLQIFGGMGLTTDLPNKKFWCNMRSMMITEWLDQILRMSFAHKVLRQYADLATTDGRNRCSPSDPAKAPKTSLMRRLLCSSRSAISQTGIGLGPSEAAVGIMPLSQS